jgi:hypothetical protein
MQATYNAFFLFIGILITLISGCNERKAPEMKSNQTDNNREINLMEKDYYIHSNKDGYLTIKIGNKNIMDRLLEMTEPVIIIHINGIPKIAKGMMAIASGVPSPCDYTFF